jgi:hypothetical protein
MLYKDLSRRTMLESARWVKPVFLYDPLREIETYRYILGPNQLSTADCYGAISRFLPTGAGLISFTTPDEALAGIEEITGDYQRHARAARVIAEEHLDSNKVLTRLLQQVDAAR